MLFKTIDGRKVMLLGGYYYETGNHFSKLQHCFTCDDSDNLCSDDSHASEIDTYYNEIIQI